MRHHVEIDDQIVPIDVRRHPRAKRISLKVSSVGEVVLVIPVRGRIRDGLAFAHQESAWIGKKLADAIPDLVFASGVTVPYFGVPHVINHAPGQRGVVWAEEGTIFVTGEASHLPRRLADWFRDEMRRKAVAQSDLFCRQLGVRASRITVRDMSSRWGSCTAEGRLSFAWRLVFAPVWVVDYVIAHEVAHLVELNHSPAFWRVVADLDQNAEKARDWLRRNGAALQVIGGRKSI